MATNNNNNGHNASIQGPGQIPNRGLSASLEQSSIRKEYADRMFNDGGYLDNSIKDLNRQSAELKRLMKQSKDLTAAEEKRYKNAINQMKKLAKEQEEIRNSQETSSKELQKSLNESAKLRGKAVDELYKKYMQGEEALNDMTSDQIEARIKYFANVSREIKATAEEINDATKEFDKANKDFKSGLSETVGDFSKATGEISKVLNLQRMASNDYLDKLNEKYEVLNDLNKTLGYGLTESSKAYNDVFKNYKEFNSKVNGLFNTDDLKSYFKSASEAGIHDEKILNSTMKSSLMAEKYLGMTNETMTSLFKYMKITNNNDTISTYNKTMIQLQKHHIGIAEDTLNQMIQDNANLSESLFAVGMDSATLEKWNTDRNILNAQVANEFGDETAKKLNETVNKIANLSSDYKTMDQVYAMGIDAQALNREITKEGNAQAAYDRIISGLISQGNSFGTSDSAAVGTLLSDLGIDRSDLAAAKTVGIGKMGTYAATTEDVKRGINNMTEQDVEDYINKNAAISDTQREMNKMNDNITDLLQNNKTIAESVEKISKYVTYLSFISSVVQGGIALFKGVNGLIKFFGNGKGLSDIFGKFLGKGSTIASGAEGSMALAGKGSGLLASGGGLLIGAAAAAALVAAINAGVQAANKGSLEHGEEVGKNSVKGTEYENNEGVKSLMTSAATIEDRGGFQNSWNNMTSGIGYGFSNIFQGTSDRNKNLTQWIMSSDTLGKNGNNIAQKIAVWGLMMNQAGYFDSFKKGMKEAGAGDWGSSSVDDLVELLINNNWTKKNVEDIANNIIRAGYKPYYSDKSRMESFTLDTSGHGLDQLADGYHKAGLNRVPKDNYKALLHKDEMVLNQEEAESYRLQKEYERNNFAGKSEMKGFGIGGSVGNYSYGNYPSYAGHTGIDFNTPIGTPIGSATSGTVVESLDKRGNQANGYASFGRWVVVKSDDNGLYYLYAHLKERLANKGQHVNAGELIGYSGNNGNVRPLPTASNPSAGQHLHFQVGTSPRGGHVNPERYATEAIFSVNGSSSSSNNSGESTDNSNSSGQKVSALAKSIHSERRLLPGIGGDGDIPDGVNPVDRIVTSVDGVSTKIIKYLDEIRAEQEDQRRLINAFSASQQTIQ